MDLPFAVDTPNRSTSTSLLHSNASSLVTASSQGSLLPSDSPEHSSLYSSNEQSCSNTIISPRSDNSDVVPAVVDAALNDFTYVTVCETDADEVDIIMDGRVTSLEEDTQRGDVLAVLLSGGTQEQAAGESIVVYCEKANAQASKAAEAKRKGDLTLALSAHSEAARLFREAAIKAREGEVSLSNSLLLLSQAQAKSALALKRFLRQHPEGLQRCASSGSGDATITSSLSQKERLRATVRGALDTRNEADISDSVFLGRATSSPPKITAQKSTDVPNNETVSHERTITAVPDTSKMTNPVDDMMELERELRDMDMALEMGNSIASLGARTQNRLKHSAMEEGSFMMVPPGSASYMSSSLWASGINNGPRHHHSATTNTITGTAGARARANRVQNILDASSAAPVVRQAPSTSSPQNQKSHHGGVAAGLESSWWGTSSGIASQALSSSIMSLGGSRLGAHGIGGDQMAGQPANTKQLMRLLDSIKTLGDENAALLREVEDAEAARAETRAIKEQMRRFKAEYGKRFAALKSALEKFRKSYPEQNGGNERNPVTSSNFLKATETLEQIQRQEQLIRKLTTDLKKEKEESKKKDAALRKYESFYREVKARSAQKAAQRQAEQRQQLQQQRVATSRAVHR